MAIKRVNYMKMDAGIIHEVENNTQYMVIIVSTIKAKQQYIVIDFLKSHV